jgi:uncharacterized membrane protein YebE (DUF533 family)
VQEIAAWAATPEQAAEIYSAALLAIEVDTEKERAWLARLAGELKLPDGLVAEIHARVADAAPAGQLGRVDRVLGAAERR